MFGLTKPPIQNDPAEAEKVIKFRPPSSCFQVRFLPPARYVHFVEAASRGVPHDPVSCPFYFTGHEARKQMAFAAVGLSQVRFPRSKKVRIRKKWRNNLKNWASTGDTSMVAVSATLAEKLVHGISRATRDR